MTAARETAPGAANPAAASGVGVDEAAPVDPEVARSRTLLTVEPVLSVVVVAAAASVLVAETLRVVAAAAL